MNDITRRTALAAPALLALPASAVLARPAEPDPFVIAFMDWREKYIRAHDFSEGLPPGRNDALEAEADRLCLISWEALDRLAEVVPTTARGIALMGHVLPEIADILANNHRPGDVFRWRPEHYFTEDPGAVRTLAFAANLTKAAKALEAAASA